MAQPVNYIREWRVNPANNEPYFTGRLIPVPNLTPADIKRIEDGLREVGNLGKGLYEEVCKPIFWMCNNILTHGRLTY